jgi:hypothetical protein
MKPSRMAGLVLLALATACSRATEPFVIPELKDVKRVIVSRVEGTSTIWRHEIRDPRRIDPILAHLREHNSGYRTARPRVLREAVSRKREYDHTIAFVGEDTTASLIILIGPDWLGGFDDRRKDGKLVERDRPLSVSEREAILALIREPDPKGRVVIENRKDN